MVLCSTTMLVVTILTGFVMLYSYIWWINTKFEEIIKLLKKK